MIVLVGITLLGTLRAELKKIFFSYGPGISSPSMNASPVVRAGPVLLGIIFFQAATYDSGPGFGQILMLPPCYFSYKVLHKLIK